MAITSGNYKKIGTSGKHYFNIIGYSKQQNTNDIILQTINFQEYFILVIFDSLEEIIRKLLMTTRIEHPLNKCRDHFQRLNWSTGSNFIII